MASCGSPVAQAQPRAPSVTWFQALQPMALLLFRGHRDVFVMLELLSGYVHLTIRVHRKSQLVLPFSRHTSYGEWHAMEVTFAETVALALLDNSGCHHSPFSIQKSSVCALRNSFLGGNRWDQPAMALPHVTPPTCHQPPLCGLSPRHSNCLNLHYPGEHSMPGRAV